MKKKILIFAGYYLPSLKGGGPIQSIKNLVNELKSDFDFYILAFDRDLGDEKPFENIVNNSWVETGGAKVTYIDPSELSYTYLKRIIKETRFHSFYINSFFSFKLTVLPLILFKLNRIKAKIIIAPRGQLSTGALGIIKQKKIFFLLITKIIGLYNNLVWHVTADEEAEEVKRHFKTKKIVVINNLTANYKNLKFKKDIIKNSGSLKVIFISRISPKKNLNFVIEVLAKIKGNIELNIFGPIEDKIYWNKCEKQIDDLKSNISVNYKGLVDHSKVLGKFEENHIFFFPTLGENFGHVISEALVGGCPLILSDQTPWRNLSDKNIGWDIPLSEKNKFIDAVQVFTDMNQKEYDDKSKRSNFFGLKSSASKDTLIKYKNIFN